MRKRFLWIICLLALTCGIHQSCAARRYESVATSAPSVTKMAELLSKRLGLRLTAEDNLALYQYIDDWIGTPHRIGGRSKRGVDCSGFTSNVYEAIFGKKLQRSSAGILKVNCERVSKDELKEGDLVFFWTRRRRSGTPSHVGIYLKEGKFVHSSSSRGVIISSLNEPYYTRRWIVGGIVK